MKEEQFPILLDQFSVHKIALLLQLQTENWKPGGFEARYGIKCHFGTSQQPKKDLDQGWVTKVRVSSLLSVCQLELEPVEEKHAIAKLAAVVSNVTSALFIAHTYSNFKHFHVRF